MTPPTPSPPFLLPPPSPLSLPPPSVSPFLVRSGQYYTHTVCVCLLDLLADQRTACGPVCLRHVRERAGPSANGRFEAGSVGTVCYVVTGHDAQAIAHTASQSRTTGAKAGLDYSKWDSLAVSDDEGEADARHEARPARASPPPDVDEVAHSFIAAQVASALPDVPHDEREALLRFLRVQDPRGGASNMPQCNQIVELLMASPALATKTSLDRTCALTRRMCFGEGGSKAPDELAPILLSAVNTLAACVEHGAINLFAEIATPCGAAAERLRLKYEQKEAGKQYMLQYMGWSADEAGSAYAEEEAGGWWCEVQ
ncbi:hypothetical protein T492DRAFT_1149178 [Pavlovales sp. CCMP2436]|nr:hypothetical protein T492DRAFT_1149178 [Pavlovales sp. CCMP2436]